MKLSEKTVSILKNFSTINNSIEIHPGSHLATLTQASTIFAEAWVSEVFETQFAIYELNKFLGVLSLFESPELTFHEKYVVLSENNTKIRYTFCDPSVLITATGKNITFPDVMVSFDLKMSEFKSLLQSAAVLELPEIAILSDGEGLFVTTTNSRNPSTDEFSIRVGDYTEPFKFTYNRDKLKLIDRAFKVNLSETGLVEFKSEDVRYVMIGEAE